MAPAPIRHEPIRSPASTGTKGIDANQQRARDMGEPDYASYSLDELRDVEQHIDRNRYPERFERVLEEIRRRLRERELAAAAPPPEGTPGYVTYGPGTRLTRRQVVGLIAGIVALFGLAGIVVIPELVGVVSTLTPVVKAVQEAHPGESIHVRLAHTTWSGTTLSIQFSNVPWALDEEPLREAKARKAARVGYLAYPGSSQISHVVVSLETRRTIGGIVRTWRRVGSYSYFPSELSEAGSSNR